MVNFQVCWQWGKNIKKGKTKATRKKLIEQYTYDMCIFLSVYRPSGKRFKKATYGRATGKSYSCCVRTGNSTVLQKRGDTSDTLRGGTVRSFPVLGLSEVCTMHFMPLQTLQLKENSGGPAEGPPPGGAAGSIHRHNTGKPRRYCGLRPPQ